MKRAIYIPILALATMAVAALPVSAAVQSNFQKSFNVSPGGKLTLETDLGSVEVRTAETSTLSVQVFREAKLVTDKEAQDLFSRFRVSFDAGSDAKSSYVSVKGTYEDKSFFHLFENSRLNVRYVVTVPSRYNVQVKTSGGNIALADLTGDVSLDTSGGDLKIGRINGKVDASTSGGDVDVVAGRNVTVRSSGGHLIIGHASGPIDARTSGGDIRIDQADDTLVAKTSGGAITLNQIAGAFDAHTSGGSISAKITQQPKGDSSLSTSGGSVSIYLADSLHLHLDADTSGGRVSTELPVLMQGSTEPSSLDAKLNGGGPTLKVHASGGNIEFKRFRQMAAAR